MGYYTDKTGMMSSRRRSRADRCPAREAETTGPPNARPRENMVGVNMVLA